MITIGDGPGAVTREELCGQLELINTSVKGKMSIAEANGIASKESTGICASNSKPDLFNIMKELYLFSYKILNSVNLTSPQVHVPDVKDEQTKTEELTSTVKKILGECLPEILKSQLEDAMSKIEYPKSAPAEKSVERADTSLPTIHTMIVEKPKRETADGGKEIEPFTESEWKISGRKRFADKLQNIPVQHATRLPDGRLKFTLSSKEDLESAVEAVKEEEEEEKLLVTSDSKERKKLDPKITISKLPDDITCKEDVDRELCNKNENIRDLRDAGLVIKTVFVDKEKKFAVVQMSPEIRESIRSKQDKVFLGFHCFPVRDRFHVVQCYHCQGFGHMARDGDCKKFSKPAVCHFCAGNHRSDRCTAKKNDAQCSNCLKSRNPRVKAKTSTHRASDELCPSYVRAKENLMSRTATVTEVAKNEYLQWAHNKQRECNRV